MVVPRTIKFINICKKEGEREYNELQYKIYY